MEDLFADVAPDYDNMFPRDLNEDGRLLRGLFRNNRVSSVLDCACGTGQHVLMLARQGYEVAGSDCSEAMLHKAEQRLREEDAAARLVRARWDELPCAFDRRFDAVICIGNSLPLAGADERVQDSLEGMLEVLAPGGLLVIQNRNMDKMVRERPEAVLNTADKPGNFTLFVFDYRDPIVIYKIFYIVTGDGKDVTYNEFPMNILTRAKLEAMLRRAGAASWKIYGDSRLAGFSPGRSPRMIAAARKP